MFFLRNYKNIFTFAFINLITLFLFPNIRKITLFFCFLSLIACLKKDNDDSPIGTWKLNSIMINRAQHILSECEKEEKIVFL